MKRFRQYLVALCTLAIIGTSFSAFASFIVATPDQVVVTPEGLFVEFEGELQIVESISMANDGHIVASLSPQAWYCKNCGKHVPYPVKNCPTCGKPNPKDQG